MRVEVDPATAGTVEVEVAYADRASEARIGLRLPAGASVADAVAASGLIPVTVAAADGVAQALAAAGLVTAIHGQSAPVRTPLRDGDRVELLRPLAADAKAARRIRAAGHPLPAHTGRTPARRPR